MFFEMIKDESVLFFLESQKIRIGNYFVTIFLTIQVVRFKPARRTAGVNPEL